MNELVLFEKDNMERLVKASNMLAKSKLIPYHLRGKVEDVFAILCMGAELGMNPMRSLNSINVIQGKTAMSAQLMLGLVRAKLPDCVVDIQQDDEKQEVTVSMARDTNSTPYVTVWDFNKAKDLGLTGKDNYQKQLMTMLRWRGISEACRIIAPDILNGFYAIEEFKDLEGNEIRFVENEREELDKDFPIPDEEKQVGPHYRFQNGKFRGLQCKDVDLESGKEYLEKLEKRIEKGEVKPWENEVHAALAHWCNNYYELQDILHEEEYKED